MEVMEVSSTGRAALGSGASRGIGPYIARSLAEAGYDLVLASRSGTDLELMAQELRESGAAVLSVAVDLTVPGDVDLLIGAAEREFGHIDVLINNAGGDPQREFDKMTWPENEEILRLNLMAPLQLTHLLLPGMLQRRRGHV